MTSSLDDASQPDDTARRPGRLPSLTGMRFLCAVLVFGTNVTVMGLFASPDTAGEFAAMVTQGGYTGVVYFFILSGFVLTWTASSAERPGAFWRRRFVKIYPAYLVALVAGIVLTVAVQGAVVNRKWAVLDLLLVQSWAPDIQTRTNINAPLWSLSVEALFYLSFPLLLRLVERVRPERLWAGAGAVVAAIFAVPVVVKFLPPGESYPAFQTTATEVWLVHQFPATRLLEFVLGIFMARIVLTRRRLPIGLGGSVALAVTAYWLATYVPARFDMVAIMVVPLALVIAAAAVQDSAGRPSWVSGRIWVRLGEISYAFYLVQWLVLLYGIRWVTGGRPLGSAAAFGLLAVLFVVTLVLGWLLHSLVERPLMRRFARSRRSPAERPAPDLVGAQGAGRRAA